MLNQTKKKYDESFGFSFKGNHQGRIVGIHSVGWEEVNAAYDWDGMKRSEVGRCVFQYTLSGQGMIDVNGTEHSLSTGKAFLVKIPSQHRYYLPQNSKSWEFVHLTLFGQEAMKTFDMIHKNVGHVISFPPDSEPIKRLLHVFDEAAANQITDAFQASALAYSFLMELYRFSSHRGTTAEKMPDAISKAVLFVQKNYHLPIGLDDIVVASNLSKYHFTRLFRKSTNTTPINYLTKVRMDKSIELLRFTNASIEEIALQVGYSNGNYFSKVFQKHIGMSPSQLRTNKYTVPVNHIVTD